MKRNQADPLKALEKEGLNRRQFMKIMAAAGLLTAVNTQEAKAFSSNATGKIVIIGGGAA